jgi:hypothetical protein
MICNIKKILLIIIAIFLASSCKKELRSNEVFIEKLSQEIDEEIPLISEPLIIIIKKEDKLFISSTMILFEEYSKNFKKRYTFEDFLDMVLNNDLFDKEQMRNVSVHDFKVDDNIANFYESKGLNYLITEYCEKISKHNTLFLKQNLDVEVQFNIMYYFFKNNYYLVEDDYEGRFILIDKN